jgi:Domain of unknown function (DUF4262)
LWPIRFSASLWRFANWKNSRAKRSDDCPPRLKFCVTIRFRQDARRMGAVPETCRIRAGDYRVVLSSAARAVARPCAYGWASAGCLPVFTDDWFGSSALGATLHRMVRDASHPDNSHPADQKFLAPIETHGWNVTNVFRRQGETGPEWSFSTGLFHPYPRPEIVIFGLKLDNICRRLSTPSVQR